MGAAPKVSTIGTKKVTESKGVVLEHAANEFVFAVVGHVGSGTSKIAETLEGLLEAEGLKAASLMSRS
jgi:energy-coupling factor transporter ATP-binding protein EcfA2